MAGGARRGAAGSPKIGAADLEGALERGKASPVYILAGPEAFLRDRALAALKRRWVSPEFEAFNYHLLEPSGWSGDAFVQELRVLPMGEGGRLMVVLGAERLVKEQITALEAYASDPAPETCLVFVVEELKETLRKAIPRGVVVDCGSPWEDRIPALLSEEARRLGLRMDPAAGAAIASRCGRDLTRAVSELTKMSLLAGADRRITREMAEELAGGGAGGDVFKVASALARGDPAGAVAAARGYLETEDRGEPRVLYELGLHLRRLLAARGNVAGGMAPAEAARAAGVFWKDVGPFVSALRAWPERRIREAYRRLLETDRRVKRGDEGLPAIEAYLWSLRSGSPQG